MSYSSMSTISYYYYKILYYFLPNHGSLKVIKIIIFILYRGNFRTEKELICPQHAICFGYFGDDNSSHTLSHYSLYLLQKKGRLELKGVFSILLM